MSIIDFSYYTVPMNNIKRHQKIILYSINNLVNIIGFSNAIKLVMQSVLIEMLVYDWRYVHHYSVDYWCNEIMKYPYIN